MPVTASWTWVRCFPVTLNFIYSFLSLIHNAIMAKIASGVISWPVAVTWGIEGLSGSCALLEFRDLCFTLIMLLLGAWILRKSLWGYTELVYVTSLSLQCNAVIKWSLRIKNGISKTRYPDPCHSRILIQNLCEDCEWTQLPGFASEILTFSFLFCLFLGPHSQHMEVPRLGANWS